MKNTKRNKRIFFLASIAMLGIALNACASTPNVDGGNGDGGNNNDNNQQTTPEKVEVREIGLELDNANPKVGDILTPKVTIRPSNATNKEFALSSSDETIAVIENGKVKCVAQGQVIITARSKDNPMKKAEFKLNVLGTDAEGRVENLFEAEDANIIPCEGGTIRAEATQDDRVSGTSVVGNLSKGDRIVWGVESSDDDTNAVLKIRLMGPSGWLGMWDSIPYTFADWYTIKVNGKILDTENIKVAGTENRAGTADYYAMVDVELGNVSLKKGLNTVTFVCSNRFDQKHVKFGIYDGNITCLGNVDSISIHSSKTLKAVAGTPETENADPDVKFNEFKIEAEDKTTRIYESKEKPQVDIGNSTSVEFKNKMNIMMGVTSTTNTKTKLRLKIATPFENKTVATADVLAKDIFTLTIDGKSIDLGEAKLLGNGTTGNKENFTIVETGWIDFKEGNSVISIVCGDLTKYEFKGSFDSLDILSLGGEFTKFLNEEPSPFETFTFEAEAATTKLVGYEPLLSGATNVEFVDAKKVQEDVYNNKLETSKIIFGIESSVDTYATLSMTMAAPFIDATTPATDVNAGSIGDLWVNGTMISTPNKLLGNNAVNNKTNYTTFKVETQIKLLKGKNRIAWEPRNYTNNTYAYLGALDKISLDANATLTAYEVNMWTDRNTYFDDANAEPILVTTDKVSETSPNSCWVGLFKEDDPIEVNNPGSIYYYYPTNKAYNSDGQEYLGKPCNIITQNPNKERPLIGAATGGHYKIVYMEKDSRNGTNGYDVTDVVHISVWDDPDNGYGGRK